MESHSNSSSSHTCWYIYKYAFLNCQTYIFSSYLWATCKQVEQGAVTRKLKTKRPAAKGFILGLICVTGERGLGEGSVHLDAASVTLSLRELSCSRCALTGPLRNLQWGHCCSIWRISTSAHQCLRRKNHNRVKRRRQQLAASYVIWGLINNLSIGHKYTHLMDDQSSATWLMRLKVYVC